MFGKSDKVKEVTVSTNGEYIIWNVDVSNVAKDATLYVEQGALGIYIVNGSTRSVNNAGRWVINSKEDVKLGNKIQLVGANADKTYEILCGIGGVPFKDFEINAETVVGAHGECKISILQPWVLCNVLGKTEVKLEDIDGYIRAKLSELMTSSLAEVLQKYDYTSINSKLSEISAEMKDKLFDEFEKIGIGIENFALKGIHFTEDFRQKRTDFFDNANRKKEEKDARRERERAQRAEIDAINSLVGGIQTPSAQTNANTAQDLNSNAPGVNVPVKYCSRCGMKLSADSIFCSGCGKKLS